jgi:O-antigen/teichoic acid export membrane protein
VSLKNIVKSTVFYTVLGFLPVASQVILAPLFTKYLVPYQYGLINLVNIFTAYAGIFIGLGYESAFSIFYFYYYKRPVWLARLISTVMLSVITFFLIAILISIFMGKWIFSLFGGDENFRFITYGIPALLITLTTVCISILQYFFRNEENLRYYCIVSISFFISITAGQLVGLLIERNAEGVIVGRMAGAAFTLIGVLFYTFRKYRLKFNLSLFRKCLVYGYPMAVYGLIWVAFENMDRLAIEKNFGKDALGIYGFAVIITSVLELVRVSFVGAVSPSIYRMIEDSSENSKRTVSSTIRFFSASTANALCLLLAISCPVVYIFINKNFHPALLFLPFLFLAMIPRIYFSFFAMPLFYFGKTKALAAINFISLLAGWIYLKFVGSSWGVFGVCSVAIVVKIIQCLGTYIYIKYISNLQVKFGFALLGKINGIILLTAASLLISMYLAVNYPQNIYLINIIPLVAVLYSLLLYHRKIKMQIVGSLQRLGYRFQKNNK